MAMGPACAVLWSEFVHSSRVSELNAETLELGTKRQASAQCLTTGSQT